MPTSVWIYSSLTLYDKSKRRPYMLIGQWVDKDSTISLCNEPLHRRSTASENRERERSLREITRSARMFARSVLSFWLTERCAGSCICGHLCCCCGKRFNCRWNLYPCFNLQLQSVFQLDDIAFLTLDHGAWQMGAHGRASNPSAYLQCMKTVTNLWGSSTTRVLEK